nr:PREDICTED: uncharacterized protein LOC105663590 isoform X2 [Megachile rotundata]
MDFATAGGVDGGKSTVHALLDLKDYVLDKRKRREKVVAIALDIKNAFNSLSWDSIVRTLEGMGVPPYLQALINSYLSNRIGKVAVEDGDYIFEISPNKTEAIIFGMTSTNKEWTQQPIKVKADVIKPKKHLKYLGVQDCTKLKGPESQKKDHAGLGGDLHLPICSPSLGRRSDEKTKRFSYN